MPQLKRAPTLAAKATPTLTIRGAVTTARHTLDHTQYLTDRYVLTKLGRATILYSRELEGRFVVDSEERKLRRVEAASGAVQIEHLREMLGEVGVHRDEEPVEVDGFTCIRYRLCNDSPRLLVSAEAYCARVKELALTALKEERLFDAQHHPFALPLDADELIIRSTTRTYANGFEHVQSYQHRSLTPWIEDRHSVEEYLRYPVANG